MYDRYPNEIAVYAVELWVEVDKFKKRNYHGTKKPSRDLKLENRST